MLIIDRYILRHFLQTLVICFLSLTGLFVVIDAFSHLDDFLAYAEQQGNILVIMGRYYTYHSLAFFDRTAPILALTAAMFTVTALQRHNELVALLAAGVRTARVVRPIVLATIAVAVVSAGFRELVLPRIRTDLSRRIDDLAHGSGLNLTPRYDQQTDIQLGGDKSFAGDQRISRPVFVLPEGLDGYGKQLVAENAYYRPPEGTRPGGYLLTGVEQPSELAKRESLPLGDRQVLFTPLKNPWLEADQCFVASEITFDQLEDSAAWRQYASTWELARGLRNPSLDYGADVRVTMHGRLVQPLLDVTLLFLGLPLVLSRTSTNVFLAIGRCFGIVVAYMLVVIGCQALGGSYMVNPALSAWLPLMVFVPLAVIISEPLRE